MITPYQDWISRVSKNQERTKVDSGETLEAPAGKPFKPVEFLRVTRPLYVGELGKKNDDFLYHFYPSVEVLEFFEDRMAQTFLEIFKLEERLQAAYAPELGSWAVKAVGFAANPLSDTLSVKVFDVLDRKLEKL